MPTRRAALPGFLLALGALLAAAPARADPPARSMGLREAIQLAVQRNLGIVLRRETALGVRKGIDVASLRFEPALTASFLHSEEDSPPITTLDGSAREIFHSQSDTWNLGVQQQLRTGTQLGLSLSNARTQSSRGSAPQPLFYRSGVELRLTQPLLRGFAFDLDLPQVDVLRAELAAQRAGQDVRLGVMLVVKLTEDAYWELAQAIDAHGVQQGSLELARQQLALTRRQIEAGVLSPSELINAESTLAQRELQLVQAEAQIADAADRLRRVLGLPREEWDRPIQPTDRPRFEPLAVDAAQALARATSFRAELVQRRLDLDRAGLDARAASADRLPQLDVGASVGLVGQKPGYADALGQIGSGDARSWGVFANLSWTPLGRASRAQLEALRATERGARAQLAQQLLDISAEVRLALRSVETSGREVKAAQRFRGLAERSLDAEQRKFLNGTVSNFFVAQRQADVAQARLAELLAAIRHERAKSDLEVAMGTLLDSRGIKLDR